MYKSNKPSLAASVASSESFCILSSPCKDLASSNCLVISAVFIFGFLSLVTSSSSSPFASKSSMSSSESLSILDAYVLVSNSKSAGSTSTGGCLAASSLAFISASIKSICFCASAATVGEKGSSITELNSALI